MSIPLLSTITSAQRTKIVTMLTSGEFPVDKDIADACGVTPTFIQKVLAEDKELAECRRQAEIEIAQRIEQSAVQMAISSRNPIAQQKAQEFMLKKLMPDKYGDNAGMRNAGQSKKINITLKLPETAVDENGIPIAQSPNPLQELIDVK